MIKNAVKSQCTPQYIRRAEAADISRIAEIYVFNNRLEYFPIFNNVIFSFKDLQVLSYAKLLEIQMSDNTDEIYVYDDGVIKAFAIIGEKEIKKLHVDSFFQNCGIGSCLLEYAVSFCHAEFLWALEKNERAIKFYESHGLIKTSEKDVLYGVNGHTEFIVKMAVNKGK